jgi:hypothetical protein
MMIYRLSAVSLGFLFAGFLGCGRSPLFDAFATSAGTMPITTGAGGGSESTGVGGTGPMTGAGTGEPGSSTGEAGNSAGRGGSSAGGQAGSSAGEAGSRASGHAGSSAGEGGSGGGGHAGSVGQGGSSGSGGASGVSVGNACNPVAQNCGPGLRCDLPDSGPLMFQCIMDAGATGSEGQICRELSQDCAKGSTCIQIVSRSGRPIGSPHCFVFCNTDTDCQNGNMCDDALLMPDGGGNSGANVRTGICR